MFGEFLDLGAGETSLKTVWSRAGDLLSNSLVPIASAAGGDLYCLRSTNATPSVAFWDHDSNRSYIVATSFTDFVARLELAPSPSVDLSKIKLTLDPDLL